MKDNKQEGEKQKKERHFDGQSQQFVGSEQTKGSICREYCTRQLHGCPATALNNGGDVHCSTVLLCFYIKLVVSEGTTLLLQYCHYGQYGQEKWLWDFDFSDLLSIPMPFWWLNIVSCHYGVYSFFYPCTPSPPQHLFKFFLSFTFYGVCQRTRQTLKVQQ